MKIPKFKNQAMKKDQIKVSKNLKKRQAKYGNQLLNDKIPIQIWHQIQKSSLMLKSKLEQSLTKYLRETLTPCSKNLVSY